MKPITEAYTRITLSIILFVLAALMSHTWTIVFISLIALYSLITGLIRLKK